MAYLLELRPVLREKKVAGYLQIENQIEVSFGYELANKIPLDDISGMN